MLKVKIILGLIALIYLIFGVMFFIDPGKYASGLGFRNLDSEGLIEIRAVYGGIQVTMGLVMAVLLFRGQLVPCAASATISFAAFGGARLIAVLMAGALPGLHLHLLILEWGLGLLSTWVWILAAGGKA